MRLHLQEQGRHGEAQELPHEGRAALQGRIQEVHQERAVRVRRMQVLKVSFFLKLFVVSDSSYMYILCAPNVKLL